MKILIVDDEANLRRMLRALLEQEGYSVLEAGSAEAGLGLLREGHPDVVLLDVVLPGASGLESLRRFQASAPGTAIVMMSGEATLSDAARATREGAFHFLEKPLTPESVLVTVRGALEVSRALPFQPSDLRASTCGNRSLFKMLKKYDENLHKHTRTLEELAPNTIFKLPNGHKFKKMGKKRVRILCQSLKNKKYYLFSPDFEVVNRD